jgi:hypothetical protein
MENTMSGKQTDSSPKDKTKKKPGEKKKSPPPDKPKTITVTEEELREMIEKRAYELYLERGGHHGEHENDWYRAEEEIKSRFKKKK